MAFLVEHISLTPAQSRDDEVSVTSPAKPPKSGAMKLFRRTSSQNKIGEDLATQRRRSTTTEPERRTSFIAIPARLRRRKTKTCAEEQEGNNDSSTQLGQLLFSLPSEILTEIISYLPLNTIYSLRQASLSFCSMINHNSSTISRHVISENLPSYAITKASRLYPVPSDSQDMFHLLRMFHRQKRIDKVIYHTMSFVQMKMYAINQQAFSPVAARTSPARQRLERSLQGPAWIVYHFFESYRNIHVREHHGEHQGQSGRFWDCQICESQAKMLVDSYDAVDVLPAYHFLQLLMLHCHAATRPPSHVGPLDRKKGRKSLVEDLSVFTLLGGIEELSKINMMQGSYTKRMHIINSFVTKVRTAADINQANAKTSGPSLRTTTTSSSDSTSGLEQDHTSNLRRGIPRDVTKSLCPPYSELTQDQLDRLPMLQDFLLPVWRSRIERDNLHAEHPEDLNSPFDWIQRIIFQSLDPEHETGTGDNHDPSDQNQNHNPNPNPNAIQNQNQTTVPTQMGPALFTSHTPTNLLPIFGAPPV